MMVLRFEGFTSDNDGLLRFKKIGFTYHQTTIDELILNEANRAVYMAHLGVMKRRADLKPLFFWKGIKVDIVNYVS